MTSGNGCGAVSRANLVFALMDPGIHRPGGIVAPTKK
jgi:hypothetical protein